MCEYFDLLGDMMISSKGFFQVLGISVVTVVFSLLLIYFLIIPKEITNVQNPTFNMQSGYLYHIKVTEAVVMILESDSTFHLTCDGREVGISQLWVETTTLNIRVEPTDAAAEEIVCSVDVNSQVRVDYPQKIDVIPQRVDKTYKELIIIAGFILVTVFVIATLATYLSEQGASEREEEEEDEEES